MWNTCGFKFHKKVKTQSLFVEVCNRVWMKLGPFSSKSGQIPGFELKPSRICSLARSVKKSWGLILLMFREGVAVGGWWRREQQGCGAQLVGGGQGHRLGLQGCANKHNIDGSPDVEDCSQEQLCESHVAHIQCGRSWRAPAHPSKGTLLCLSMYSQHKPENKSLETPNTLGLYPPLHCIL